MKYFVFGFSIILITVTLWATENFGALKLSQSTIPAPSEQNATLLGIDSDKDGIRDDVKAWINTTYSNQPNVKIAAEKYAHAYQNGFANKDNKQNSIIATKNLIKANNCLLKTLKAQGMTTRESIREKDKLKLLHTNTKERIMAKEKINEHFHGNSFKVQSKEESCDF